MAKLGKGYSDFDDPYRGDDQRRGEMPNKTLRAKGESNFFSRYAFALLLGANKRLGNSFVKPVLYKLTLWRFRKFSKRNRAWLKDFHSATPTNGVIDKGLQLSLNCLQLYAPFEPITLDISDYHVVVIKPHRTKQDHVNISLDDNLAILSTYTWLRLCAGVLSISYARKIRAVEIYGEAEVLLDALLPLCALAGGPFG